MTLKFIAELDSQLQVTLLGVLHPCPPSALHQNAKMNVLTINARHKVSKENDFNQHHGV